MNGIDVCMVIFAGALGFMLIVIGACLLLDEWKER